MARLEVTVLVFGERERATLTFTHGLLVLVLQRGVYRPNELPMGTRILVPPVDDVPPEQRLSYFHIVASARRAGFDVETEATRRTPSQ